MNIYATGASKRPREDDDKGPPEKKIKTELANCLDSLASLSSSITKEDVYSNILSINSLFKKIIGSLTADPTAKKQILPYEKSILIIQTNVEAASDIVGSEIVIQNIKDALLLLHTEDAPSEPSAAEMTSLLTKISNSTNSDPCLFQHKGKWYAIWTGLVSGTKIVNIQLHQNWSTRGPDQQKQKLGFGLDTTGAIISTRVDNEQKPSIGLDRQHLLNALDVCINDSSVKIELLSLMNKASLALPSGSFKLTQEQKDALIKIREPLTCELSKYFTLDSFGYIIEPKPGVTLDTIEKAFLVEDQKTGGLFGFNLFGSTSTLTSSELSLAKKFYEVSAAGDAAYAEDIRTTLAGMNISSSPVNKDAVKLEGKAHDLKTVRPVSFVKSKSVSAGTIEPGKYASSAKKKESAYIDSWGNAVWKGNRDYRRKQAVTTKLSHKEADKMFTSAQLVDYERRLFRIRDLHDKGLLLGRVADTAEVKDFIGHRYRMHNDILSTSLWPKHRSPVIMQLFSEYGSDTIGLLLDPSRVGEEDFGVSFKENAVTVGQGFQRHKSRRKGQPSIAHQPNLHGIEGAKSLRAQQELLEALSAEVREGGSVDVLQVALSDDGSHYEVKKPDVRTDATIKKSKKVNWNEQTFYRGIERNFFAGLFVKSDSDSFSNELKGLFELQDRIRRTKGVYVPIFQFKGSTNELEELVPDKLLLSITGAKNITPIEGRTSQFSQELQKAGITEQMALDMSKAIENTKKVKSLFELQLLMFNMKDIMGQMTIAVQSSYGGTIFEPVRILENLHLVFPTIHKTQSTQAKQPDWFFSDSDVALIKGTPALADYLKITLKNSLSRFLGISINKNMIAFDKTNSERFDQTDEKKSDFAKVLSRAVQSAVLFQIYGADTNKIMSMIVAEIRKTWPYIGITPGGIDMILGSNELQAILKKNGLQANALSGNIEPPKSGAPQMTMPTLPYSLDTIDPFNLGALPDATQIKGFLSQLAINGDGSVNDVIFSKFKAADPHLLAYETALIPALQMLLVVKEGALAKAIITNIRKNYPSFGYTATGQDHSLPQRNTLMGWLEDRVNNKPPRTEFPFAGETKVAAATPKYRARYDPIDEEDEMPMGRFGGRGALFNPVNPTKSIVNKPKIDDKGLQKEAAKVIPKLSADQHRVAKKLGFVDSQNIPLWMIDPVFHGGNTGKPKVPYINVRDLLGHHVAYLMTGPAFDQATVQQDRDSFQIEINPKIISKQILEHLITDVLAVTTEGDNQILRLNGLQYSRSVNVPMGGNIEFNGGNEKHRFHSNDARKFHRATPQTKGVGYQGLGAYFDSDLAKVEAYDKMLLSDKERRLKAAGVIQSAFLTMTAEGGYGTERKPLDRAYRPLYIHTIGRQFEKHGRGAFTYQDGTVDENELEASDFIRKPGTSAHKSVQATESSKLGDGDFSKPYVELKDGAFFTRADFQKANDEYLLDLVIPHASKRTKNQPIYLKATLFGGGFFAQTDNAGSVRPEVINAMLGTYIKGLNQGLFPAGSVIEFPRYGEQAEMPAGLMDKLKQAAAQNGVEIVWTPQGDLCDFREQTSLRGQKISIAQFEAVGCLVILGAGDAMSLPGDEAMSASLDSSFFNNGNGRLVMNPFLNDKVFDAINHIVKN